MSMYTGIRINVTVKEQYRELIKDINEGAEWEDYAQQFPFLASYAEKPRSFFIPNGDLSYMPDSWETEQNLPASNFTTKIDMQTGQWTFQCSLNNANQEIEQFFDNVLATIISDSEHIEYFHETWDASNYYMFDEGKIVLIK